MASKADAVAETPQREAGAGEPQGKSIWASLNLNNAQSGQLPVEFQSQAPPTQQTLDNAARRARLLQEELDQTRRSQRAIKRKKFDDEIVDTAPVVAPPGFTNPLLHPSRPVSVAVAEYAGPVTGHLAGRYGQGSHGKVPGSGKSLRSRAASLNAELIDRRKPKDNKKKKQRKDGAWKGLGRWKPTDDLALITAVTQTNDLAAVHRGIKFSCHFTQSDVQTRWHALMYNPIISKLALMAIRNLNPEVVLQVQRKTLFSKAELDTLSTIKSSTSSGPTITDFEDMLLKNPNVFHHARTAWCLQQHWQGLKQYTLLPDQSVQPLPRDNHILNFLDAESNINDGDLYEPRDPGIDHELAVADRKVKREIRHLEAEIQKWQVLVDKVRGENPPDFDNQTLAVLRGRLVRYLMRSKEITLGRSTKDQTVDVDLKLEGSAWKISRRQGVIKLRNTGQFIIVNEGKRSIFVDGKPVRRGSRVKLANNSVLEIAALKFVFLINQDLIDAIRNEAAKLYGNSS